MKKLLAVALLILSMTACVQKPEPYGLVHKCTNLADGWWLGKNKHGEYALLYGDDVQPLDKSANPDTVCVSAIDAQYSQAVQI